MIRQLLTTIYALLVVGLVTVLGSGVAHATAVPPAAATFNYCGGTPSSFGVYLNGLWAAPGRCVAQPGSFDITTTAYYCACDTTEGILEAEPQPYLSVSGVGVGGSGTGGEVQLLAYFELIGPPGTVPLQFIGGGIVNSDGTGTAAAEVTLNSTSAQYVCYQGSSAGQLLFGGTNVCGTYSFDLSLSVGANQPILFTLMVGIAGGYSNATAIIDPILEIDPGFANASLYSIILSPGIGNSAAAAPPSSVPEPATLALFGAGLLGSGFIYRRRSAKRTAPG